jgi:CheY-like chemotaxis protein
LRCITQRQVLFLKVSSSRVKPGQLAILLVEDDENDIVLVRRAIQASGAGHRLHAVRDGEQAVAYLKGFNEFADREKFPIPNILLTDLKMPKMGGLDLLRWVRANPEYSVIPTIVYSSSDMETDVREAYRLGANSYIAKPSSLSGLVDTLRIVYDYWSRCEIPPEKPFTVERVE